MKTEELSLDTRIAAVLLQRMEDEKWPAGIEMGLPFESENGNMMRNITVHYADEFPMDLKIDEIINQVFNLK